MPNGNAKAQGPHPLRVVHGFNGSLNDPACQHVVAGDQFVELSGVVAAPARPANLSKIGAVGNAVVIKRNQPLLFDGVPKSQFGGNAVVKPVQYGLAVTALGGGGQPEQLPWLQEFQKLAVGSGFGVMKFVDDHHVEVIGRHVFQPGSMQALNGGKDVLEFVGPLPTHPQLAEVGVAERMTKGGQALFQNFLAMRDRKSTRLNSSHVAISY